MARGRPATPRGHMGEINAQPTAFDNETGKPTKWRASTYLRLWSGESVRVRAVGKSKNDAKKRLQERCTQRLGERSDHAELTSTSKFSRLLDEYIATKKTDGTRPQSVDRYTDVTEKYLRPTFGELRLNEITPLALDQWLHNPKRKNVHQCRTVLNGALNLALLYRLIDSNPMASTRPLKKTKKVVDHLEPHQVIEFLEDMLRNGSQLIHDVCVIALTTSARAGEALSLNFSDFDFSANPPVVTLQSTIAYAKSTGNGRQEYGKTNASTRSMTVGKHLAEIYERTWKHHGEHLPMLFPSGAGTYIWENNFNDDFRTAKGEKWKHVTIHTLRRTFTTAAEKNLTPTDLATVVGHTTSAFTQKFYVARDAVDVTAFADLIIPDKAANENEDKGESV